jgi:cytochrome P450
MGRIGKQASVLLQTCISSYASLASKPTHLGPSFMVFLNSWYFREHSRAMLRPQFAREQISDLELEEYHVQNMMRAITVDPESGWSKQVDLQVLFFRLTLDSATELLFGESADSQIAELPENEILSAHGKPTARDEVVFANAFDTSQKALSTRLRFADKYWLYSSASFRSANKICHEFIDHYVQIALKGKLHSTEAPNAKKVAKKEKYVFLEALVTQTRDPIELRSQLLNILLAGRDTTASLLGWLFYLLARYPAIFYRLRTTVVSEFGTYASPTEISFTKIKSCQYLQRCLSETLRLYPVVPMNIRYATKDTTLPVGGGLDGTSPVFVKKGMQVEYSVHVMHRRKDLWGEDADEFRPERWGEGGKVGWDFLPFNGGPRICIGREFSLHLHLRSNVESFADWFVAWE